MAHSGTKLMLFELSRDMQSTYYGHGRKWPSITIIQYRGSISWWHHQMETFSALLAICVGNSPVPGEFPHKGQWRGALMSSLICARINGWVNNRKAGDLRRNGAHYDVIVMKSGYINYMKVTVLTICRACRYHLMASLIARFMGPTWSSPGASRTQVGPIWATWKLLSGLLQICCKSSVYVMK